MNNILKTTISGNTVYFDELSGCLGTDLLKLRQYVTNHSLSIPLDKPSAGCEQIQGFFFVLTTKCNLNCSYCYSISQNKPLSMGIGDPVSILRKYLCEDSRYVIVNFFGGEPTLEMDTIKNTVDFLKTLSGRKIYLRISTNGVTSQNNLDYLIDNGFHITLSSDGYLDTGSPLAKVRKADLVEQTIRHLKSKKALFTVRYTATSANISNLVKSIDYWHSLGVPLAHIEPYHPIGNGDAEKNLLPDVREYSNFFLDAVDQAQRVGLLVSTGAYMNLLTPSTYFCTGAGGRFCVYNPDGSISTCYRVQSFDTKYKEFLIGNWKTDDCNPLWTKNKNTLQCHTVTHMNKCSSCVNKNLCSGGCIMRNLTQSGTIETADQWLCSMKHLILKDAINRLWNILSKGQVPVILGRFLLENHLAKNPSLPGPSREFSYDLLTCEVPSDKDVIDIFSCIGIQREDEFTVFNRKIARTECL